MISSDGEGTATPAHIQVVSLIPYRYGTSSQEAAASYLRIRIQAFVSRAIFASPIQTLSVGGPIVGFCEPTSGDSLSAQLVSWGPAVPNNRPFRRLFGF